MKRLFREAFTLAVLSAATARVPVLAQAPRTSLASLIEAGNRKAALEMIRAGADVNEAQPDGTRPLQWAVFRVDYELVDALLAKKAKADVTNEFGSSPLAEAVKLADSRLVKTLLAAGASPESPNGDGETALMLAIKTGDLPVVNLLLNAGAKVNVAETFHHQTPLMYAAAAQKNPGPLVRLLLAKDADVKSRALFNDWPSQISSEPRAQYRPVGGLTPLLYAARDGCLDCIDALLAAGAPVNMPTPEAVTPLMLALDNDHNDAARLLLDHGANPNLRDWWGRSALYIAIDRKESAGGRGGRGGTGGQPAARGARSGVSSMEILNLLLAANVDVNVELSFHRPNRGGNSGRFGDNQLSTGATPLFRATQSSDVEVIQALLAKGANPNINSMGFTPFLLAAGVNPAGRGGAPNMTLVELMLQHGANVNTQVKGTRTYSMRISYHPPPDKEGASALHEAAQAGRTDMVRYLLDKGADPQLVDGNGRRPIDLAGGGRAGGAAAPAGPAVAVAAPATASPAGGRGAGTPAANPAALTEIRNLLQNAASKKPPL